MNKKYKLIALIGESGSGKAQPNSTVIPTPNGYKQIKDLGIGDYIFNRKGEPKKILGLYPQGEKQVYKITLKDGRYTYCCEDHLWSCFTSKNNLKIFSTKQLKENGLQKKDGGYKYKIPINQPVQYSKKEYQIDPYILGCFIGDGCNTLSLLTLSSADQELVNKIGNILGAEPVPYSPDNKTSYNWKFKDKKTKVYLKTKNIFQNFSKELITTCDKKRIPNIYKFGSIEQRLSLIQGLMDTDGYISEERNENRNNLISYSSINKDLILDISEILNSLGIINTINLDKRTEKYSTGICYRLNISISNKNKEKLFCLSRKKSRALAVKNKKDYKNYFYIPIIDIKEMPYQEEMTCLYINDKEHLYLTNDYIVTHNTTIFSDIIKNNADKFHEIVSYTTRPKREGEQDDINYHFISLEEFQHLVKMGKMLEYTSFNNWFYGTGINSLVEDKINIGVFNPAGLGGLTNHPDIDLKSYHIWASDKERLLRQLNREKNPDVDEIIRRYRVDQLDFARIGLVFPEMQLLYNNTKSDYLNCVKVISETAFGQN